MRYSSGPSFSPPQWVTELGAQVYHGLILLFLVGILFGAGMLVFSRLAAGA